MTFINSCKFVMIFTNSREFVMTWLLQITMVYDDIELISRILCLSDVDRFIPKKRRVMGEPRSGLTCFFKPNRMAWSHLNSFIFNLWKLEYDNFVYSECKTAAQQNFSLFFNSFSKEFDFLRSFPSFFYMNKYFYRVDDL